MDQARDRKRWAIIGGTLWIAVGALLASSAGASEDVPSRGRAEGALDDGEPRVAAELVVHPDTRSFSAPVQAGVLLEMDPGWHVYWKHPGETGLPTRVHWDVEDGEASAVAWPAPSVFQEGDGLFTTYGYADEVLLGSVLRFHAPQGRTRRIAARVELLACERECIPASFDLERTLVAGAQVVRGASELRGRFERWARRVPANAQELGIHVEARYARRPMASGDSFAALLGVSSCPGGDPASCAPLALGAPFPFVPDPPQAIAVEEVAVARATAYEATLRLTGSATGDVSLAEERLRGVLALQQKGGTLRHIQVDVPLAHGAAGGMGASWLYMLCLAFLGGLILNAMPCVLPILAIKVCAVAELAHRDRREVLAQGLAYTTGILASMAVLAALVIALRAAGRSVGWGFQFQEPLFLAAVSTVLVVFALNLFGVFEIGIDTGRLAHVGARSSGTRRSGFEGLLAVVLATPCTAPFLGTAAGFAFAGSPASIFAIFLCIGLGLAAPFLLVTWVPGWARLVPRAGPWTLRLRSLLGFALLASVVWLLWVLGRIAGVDGLIGLLGFHVVVASALWLYGLLQQQRPRWLSPAAAAAAALLVLGGYNAVSFESSGGSPVTPDAWEPYAAAAVEARVRQGHPVFVVFTADWCLTCKVNERAVIAHPRVEEAFDRLGVARFRADWTRRDETLRAELQRFGRAGVPLYLVYHPARPDRPTRLPELLTVDRVLEALEAPGTLDRGA